ALQEVQIQLVGTAACNTLYNIDPDLNIGRDPVKPDMICAGYTKGQRDSCQGLQRIERLLQPGSSGPSFLRVGR
ncbi:unnamed protein product, partial [Eretmochelys imbricata]